MINVLHRATKLNIHIAVDANQSAFVLRLAPFETDDDFFVDSIFAYLLVEDQGGEILRG